MDKLALKILNNTEKLILIKYAQIAYPIIVFSIIFNEFEQLFDWINFNYLQKNGNLVNRFNGANSKRFGPHLSMYHKSMFLNKRCVIYY